MVWLGLSVATLSGSGWMGVRTPRSLAWDEKNTMSVVDGGGGGEGIRQNCSAIQRDIQGLGGSAVGSTVEGLTGTTPLCITSKPMFSQA